LSGGVKWSTEERLKTKKPAAGGGAAGFPKYLNTDWEEECQCSVERPWEEEWPFCIEALREEVHCFDRSEHTPMAGDSKRQCCTAAMHEMQGGMIMNWAGPAQ
jgi:hypothetical protein